MKLRVLKDAISVGISILALVVSLWSLQTSRRNDKDALQVTFALKKMEAVNTLSQIDDRLSHAWFELEGFRVTAVKLGAAELAKKAWESENVVNTLRARVNESSEQFNKLPPEGASQETLLLLVKVLSDSIAMLNKADTNFKDMSALFSEKLKQASETEEKKATPPSPPPAAPQ